MKKINLFTQRLVSSLSCFLIMILISSNIFDICAQESVKSSYTFRSTLYPPNSEDWPLSLIQASDCYHQFFGGYVQCEAQDCGTAFRIPVLAKIDPQTKKVIWELDYSVAKNNGSTKCYGSYNSIYEEGDFIWAIGSEQEYPDAVDPENPFLTWRTVINKVNSSNGIPESGYPKFLDLPNLPNTSELERGFDMKPVFNNNQFEGFIIAGTIDYLQSDAKAFLVKLGADGEFDTHFDTDGIYLSDNEGTLARTVIVVENSSLIRYAFAGEKLESGAGPSNGYKSDAYFEGISEDGKLIWNNIINESDLISNININYIDIDYPETIDCCGFSRTTEDHDNERAYSLIQDDDKLIGICTFDYLVFDPNSGTPCTTFSDFEQFKDNDIAVVKMDYESGDVELAVNATRFSGDDYYPIIEKRGNFYYMLGSKTFITYGAGQTCHGGTKTAIVKLNQDLDVIWEKVFNTNGNVNCAFDFSFDCDDQIIITGNNEHNNEDYYFYRLGSDCQSNITFTVPNNVDITTNVPWSSSKKVAATIRVKSGGILTINSGAVIEFGSSWDLIDYNVLAENDNDTKVPRIIVESGGELVLDNCTLRGLSDCSNNSMWDGVEVQNGGTINISNGATIMDAKYGILADRGSYNSLGSINPTESSGGGIIQSDDALITNCRRGIHFANCASNPSSISSTTFSCTGYLKDPSYKTFIQDLSNPEGVIQRLGTSAFVSANDAPGMNFSGCTWNNSASLPPNLRGYGIISVNSKYKLNGGSSMSGLNIGIQADATDPKRFIYVSGSNEFTGNQTGIFLRGGNLHSIVGDNTFVPKFSILSPIPFYAPAGVGIYNAGSSKIRIEDNTFTAGNYPTVNNRGTYGIITENSGSAASLHKKNTFTNIQYGDQTQKNNGGLNLWCNEHEHNKKAWFINPQTAGAFPDQGQCNGFFNLTPENEFKDPACQTSLNHIQSSVTFEYWKKSSENYYPDCNSNVIGVNQCSQLQLNSGCNESISLTPGNVNDYFTSVGNMSEGTERELLVNELLRFYIEEDKLDTVLLLLSNESGENYKMAHALLLLDQNEISEAEAVVESLPVNSNETQSFTDYFEILVYAKQNELTLAELSEEMVTDLEDIAENRTIGGYSAQVVLSNYYGKEYLSVLETDTSIEYRSKKGEDFLSTLSKNVLRINPNPVSESISVNYRLDGFAPYTFSILSLDGKEKSRTLVNQRTGQLIINAEFLLKGVYILRVTNSSEMMENQKFIKN